MNVSFSLWDLDDHGPGSRPNGANRATPLPRAAAVASVMLSNMTPAAVNSIALFRVCRAIISSGLAELYSMARFYGLKPGWEWFSPRLLTLRDGDS